MLLIIADWFLHHPYKRYFKNRNETAPIRTNP